MTPMLGILASQITGHLSTNSFESIQTVTVGLGGQSSISFSSIPSTYKHLQIRYIVQSSRATNNGDFLQVRLNGDTGSNYYLGHQLQGDGSSVSSYGNGSGTAIYIERISNTQTGSNIFAGGVTDILDYQNTNKNKTTRSLIGYDLNGTVGGSGGQINFASGLWMSTAAINSIEIKSGTGSTFAQYSSFALYGVK